MRFPAASVREREIDLACLCPLRSQKPISPAPALSDRGLPWSEMLLGVSPSIERLREDIAMVAQTDVAILVLGETGVGKELVAQCIHERSPRRHHPMITVNCTAIPSELFESEFFGHVRGAFRGAARDRIGRFQLADGGTLFLDEVGELPLHLQPKLLRVLQDGEFQAVGEDKTRRVNVRIIAATNRELKTRVREGRFREDLYYRLSVFPTQVPPLRERKDDLRVLAEHFLAEACRRYNRGTLHLRERHLNQLRDYAWPGNVRELRNAITRGVIAATNGELVLRLDESLQSAPASPLPDRAPSTEPAVIFTDREMKRAERDNIEAALRQSEGRIYGSGGAAELLGVKPTTLNARIKKLHLGKHL